MVGENPPKQRLLVSIPDQRMLTYEEGRAKQRYPVSTSRFGVGDKMYSNRTPLGRLQVVDVIGKGLPKGMRLYSRQPTGEILKPNTTVGDAIVSRIVRMRGLEACNAHTYRRNIYIHGTTDEKDLKKPVSWGCVRMGSSDIIRLCKWVKPGAEVMIVEEPLPPRKCCSLFGRWFQGKCAVEKETPEDEKPADEKAAPTAPPEILVACKAPTADPQHPAQ